MTMLAARPSGIKQSQSLIGESDAMNVVRADVESAARSDAKVLLTGETGVGKEVIARAVHQRSNRSNAPIPRPCRSSVPWGAATISSRCRSIAKVATFG